MRLNDEMRREMDVRLKSIAAEQGKAPSAPGLPRVDVLLSSSDHGTNQIWGNGFSRKSNYEPRPARARHGGGVGSVIGGCLATVVSIRTNTPGRIT
jgi:hypothetical protein